jgi:hypothetical protein
MSIPTLPSSSSLPSTSIPSFSPPFSFYSPETDKLHDSVASDLSSLSSFHQSLRKKKWSGDFKDKSSVEKQERDAEERRWLELVGNYFS